MTIIGITGHRGLTTEIVQVVDARIRTELEAHETIIGVSCLADGADQLFAEAVVDADGSLTVIVPAAKYREELPADCRSRYDALLGQATNIIRLNHIESNSQAHMEASEAMLDLIDVLIAVWDQEPARGYGGTADVVKEAKKRGISTIIVWPDGVKRP